MADATAFTKLVPGFDFLQGLVKNAGQALPNVGQWIAPTLDPQELEKRIEQLRTVQFWLEQNARMLGATIQALEVQRMTLSTLKNMNLSMGELRDSLSLKPAEPDNAAAAPAPRSSKAPARAPKAAAAAPAGVVDPMQWWGALTKQFTELAATAMKDSATDAAKNLAGHMVKQSFEAANETLKKAVAVPASVARTAAGVARTATTAAAGARARSARARKTKPKTGPKTGPKT